jgi:hypothetical protein
MGLEPTRPKALVPKTSVSTIPPQKHDVATVAMYYRKFLTNIFRAI